MPSVTRLQLGQAFSCLACVVLILRLCTSLLRTGDNLEIHDAKSYGGGEKDIPRDNLELLDACSSYMAQVEKMIAAEFEQFGDAQPDPLNCSQARILKKLRDSYGLVLMPLLNESFQSGHVTIVVYNCFRGNMASLVGQLSIWARLVGPAIVSGEPEYLSHKPLSPAYNLHFDVFDPGEYQLDIHYRAWHNCSLAQHKVWTPLLLAKTCVDYFAYPGHDLVTTTYEGVPIHQSLLGIKKFKQVTSEKKCSHAFGSPFSVVVHGTQDKTRASRQCSIRDSQRPGRWVRTSLNDLKLRCPFDPRCEIKTETTWTWMTPGCEWSFPSENEFRSFFKQFSTVVLSGSSLLRWIDVILEERQIDSIISSLTNLVQDFTGRGVRQNHTAPIPRPRNVSERRLVLTDMNAVHAIIWKDCSPGDLRFETEMFAGMWKHAPGDFHIFYRYHYMQEFGFSMNSCEPFPSHFSGLLAEDAEKEGFVVFDANRLTRATFEGQPDGQHLDDEMLRHVVVMLFGAIVNGNSAPIGGVALLAPGENRWGVPESDHDSLSRGLQCKCCE